MIAPVGQPSRHAECVQCLQTSELISQRNCSSSTAAADSPSELTRRGFCCSMNATCLHVFAPSPPLLSYDVPPKTSPSSGTRFHSLQATSHALQPMQSVVSVKNPIRGCASAP